MYHIVKTKSKSQPFQVINIDPNNSKVINTSELLTTKPACITNIIASIGEVFCSCSSDMYVVVQDDTLKKPAAFTLYDNKKRVYNIDVKPKYEPGKNKKSA